MRRLTVQMSGQAASRVATSRKTHGLLPFCALACLLSACASERPRAQQPTDPPAGQVEIECPRDAAPLSCAGSEEEAARSARAARLAP